MRALQARPQIEAVRLGIGFDLQDKCDACGRSNHPATWRIRFVGKPYHPETLEDVDNEEDSDDDDSENSRGTRDAGEADNLDSNGRVIPGESVAYAVGKTCRANAVTAHALAHWKHHLNAWVIKHLEEETSHLKPEKIVERDGWSTKKRRKFANRVADEMEAKGEVKRLWREWRGSIREARASGMAEDRFGRG